MTQYSPTFNPKEFELRNYTNPYFTPDQQTQVTETEGRVEQQLDFVAQMLGWNGPNYWSSLANTVSEKRQLLGGTYGVYNSFVIPKVYEIRNWNNTFLVDRLQFLAPGRRTYVERVVIGDDTYALQNVEVEGDKYVISIGTLPQSFYDQVAANVPIRVDIPTYRPAPFYRPFVGASGDNDFACVADGTSLKLYPLWDTQKQFPYLFPILFAGSVYYFNQPVSFTPSVPGADPIVPEYDADRELWYLSFSETLTANVAGIEGYLTWGYSDTSTPVDASVLVKVQQWVDPSDWGQPNVLENFRGVWNNKGGDLPFNLVFDSLSIHGFNEAQSVLLNPITRTLTFNDLITTVYSQRTTQSLTPPPDPRPGDLWWHKGLGYLAAWFPNATNCGFWVEIDYRHQPCEAPSTYVFPDVAAFEAGIGSIPQVETITILNIADLNPTNNILGIQGILRGPGSITFYGMENTPYWIPTSIHYANVADFSADSHLLPYKVPVTIANATGLQPDDGFFQVSNLGFPITQDYEVVLTKYYNNKNWVASPDSLLRYIAETSMYSPAGLLQGEMWWDYVNPDPDTRLAAIFYELAWVAVNRHNQSGPPAPTLDMSTLVFYADGERLTDGVKYTTEHYSFTYASDSVNGTYEFVYAPRTFLGKTQFPKITMSDELTSVYVEDLSQQIFGGVNYFMSPNVYDAETPLRLWKAQALEDAETIAHLAEDNYINPLLADVNNGPGPENWERYFVRLPLDYGRNENHWQRTVLTCENFGYWGTPIFPEKMRCPPEDDVPAIYEELFLYDDPVPDYTYVYCESYLYSNIAYYDTSEPAPYRNSGIFPASDVQFDEFYEAELISYDPLHNRQANVDSPVNMGYGDWLGQYVNINPCRDLTGHLETDLLSRGVEPVEAPIWDASIYKYAPNCENDPESYSVDSNHFKVGYSYFVADASASEDGFFDVQQEIAWRYPSETNRTGYLLPR